MHRTAMGEGIRIQGAPRPNAAGSGAAAREAAFQALLAACSQQQANAQTFLDMMGEPATFEEESLYAYAVGQRDRAAQLASELLALGWFQENTKTGECTVFAGIQRQPAAMQK